MAEQGAGFLASSLHNVGLSNKRATALFAAEYHGLTLPQLAVLEAISMGGPPSQTDLVDRTGIDRSTLADIVRRLRDVGMLKRQRTEKDRRAYAVTLTDAGSRALRDGRRAASKVETLLLREWPAMVALRAAVPAAWSHPQSLMAAE